MPPFSGTQPEHKFFTHNANWCNKLTHKSVAPTRNLQDIKDKHANQPTKKCATPCYVHVLRLLNHSGNKQIILKAVLCNAGVVVLPKALITLMHTSCKYMYTLHV